MKKLGFILLLLWHLDLKAAAEAKKEDRASWVPVGNVHHYAGFLELAMRKEGRSFIESLIRAQTETEAGRLKIAEHILEEELGRVMPMSKRVMKSSVGLREEAFTILFDKESGDARIPDDEKDLLRACEMLIESARLESPHSDTESSMWIEDLEKFGSITEGSLIKMTEDGNLGDATRLLATIWNSAVKKEHI